MADDKTIPDLPEISVIDATSSFLVVDNGVQTYKIKPVNIPGLPKTPSTLLTISAAEGITPTSWYALGYAYADKNDVWKLNFDISLLINSTTDNNWTLAIEGVEFFEDMYQFVGVSTGGANINEFNATTVPGTNQIRVRISNSVPGDYVRVSLSGDVYIEAKPDWADDISSPGDGFIPGEGGGAVNSVNGFTGDVTLTTSDIPEGSRPYFTDPRARAAAVQDAITAGVADRAPSQKAVYTALDARQATSQKNQANGYPGLDGSGKIPLSTIPGSILGALIYQGAWSALGGTYPPSPTKGYYWIINVAGTISGVTYNVKDWIVYNGSGWDKVSGSESPSVLSVNAKTGTVVLDTDDLAEGAGNKFFTDARARGAAVQDAISDGVSNIAPSQNAVFDALALAASTTTTLLADKEDKSAKGAANGYAPLGADSKVPIANLPSIAGGIPTDIANGDYENTSNGATPVGWVGYTDAAAATPVDGTGGTVDPTLTFSVSTTDPLRGTRSAILSKPASNMQGKGWSFDFPMPKADIGNKHRIRVDIEASTNYVQDDLRFYIYDVTNSVLITPNVASVPKYSGKTWEIYWNASSSASYRLIMHVASTSALAWTMKVDTWIVNCEPFGAMSPVGEYERNTPATIFGSGSNPALGSGGSVLRSTQKIVNWAEIRWEINNPNAGSAGTGYYYLTMPAGLTVDPDLLQKASTNGFIGYCGDGWLRSGSTTLAAKIYFDRVSSRFVAQLFNETTAFGDWAAGLASLGNTTTGTFKVKVPVAEWSSGVSNVGPGSQPVYASNSSTSTANDSTSFQYGEDGALVQAFAPSGTVSVAKRVRSPYPNPKFAQLQYKAGTTSQWVNAANSYVARSTNGTDAYGAWIFPVPGSATDYDVRFQSRVDAVSGNTWAAESSSGCRWRVVFAESPAAVGFGVSPDSASLVKEGVDEGSFVANFNLGMNTGTNNMTINWIRLGKLVLFDIPSLTVTVGVTSATWGAAAGTVPVGLRPNTSKAAACILSYNGKVEPGYFQIGADGSINVFRAGEVNFTSGVASTGIYVSNLSYRKS